MPVKELDFSQTESQGFKSWLSQFSITVVIFAWSDWRRRGQCQLMRQIIEECSKNPHYRDCVVFFSLNADENGGPCQELSIIDTPCVLILKDGKEAVRFRDATSKEAITYNLELLLDRARNHMRVKTGSGVAPSSVHSFG